MKQSKNIQKSIILKSKENLNYFHLNKNEICQSSWGTGVSQ